MLSLSLSLFPWIIKIQSPINPLSGHLLLNLPIKAETICENVTKKKAAGLERNTLSIIPIPMPWYCPPKSPSPLPKNNNKKTLPN
jgi:hypothetical protein